ncbi:MAG: hypothetical protein CVU95_10975 [Firmicutes bacterium HGW-Firmicutes-2]|jgi:tetratricopeptide (TPR) repeat protein|nr:MAG: hypothetical protein CVU95_10975 [Firmicutes bacterium HGW-Firmicutes-2]
MLVNRIYFILVTFFTMLTFILLLDNYILAGIITLLLVGTGYIFIALSRNKKRLHLLEDLCDPYAFIEATERQRAITGKDPKINAYLNVDYCAGLILLGRFQEAKDLLLSIDQKYLSKKNGTLLIYTINLISCCYGMGEIPEAEVLFETKIPLLSPVNSKLTLYTELLIAERLYMHGKLLESKEKYNECLVEKISLRQRLCIFYSLAQIDEAFGDLQAAHEKYEEVVKYGNRLWVAEDAQLKLQAHTI